MMIPMIGLPKFDPDISYLKKDERMNGWMDG